MNNGSGSLNAIWYEALRCSVKTEERVNPTGDRIGVFPTLSRAVEAATKLQHLLVRLNDEEYAKFCAGKLKSTKAYYIRALEVVLIDELGAKGRTADGRVVELTDSMLMSKGNFGSAQSL